MQESEHTAEKEAPLHSILVVDDDSITRKTLRAVLVKQGFRVLEAHDGAEAIVMFNQTPVDLILLDVVMPGMNGFDVCRLIRDTFEYQALPILMLTALDDVDSVERAFDAGATDFITKPINWALLGQRLRYALKTRAMYSALKKQEQRLVHAQKIAKLGYWELDWRSMQMSYSREAAHIMGVHREDLDGGLERFLAMVHEDYRSQLSEELRTSMAQHLALSYEFPMSLENRGGIVIHLHGEPLRDAQGTLTGMSGVLQDVTERKRDEAIIEYQSNYDALTGLPNRQLFEVIMQEKMRESTQREKLLGLVFLGIDRMEVVNDSLGHQIGDKLLLSVAKRVRASVGDAGVVARFSGDIIAICIPDACRIEHINTLIEGLRDKLSGAHSVAGQQLYPTVSFGGVVFPLCADDSEGLLKCADAALSVSRKRGGNQVEYYSPQIMARVCQRVATEQGLRLALEKGYFVIFYQPQIDAYSGRIVGMEALLRWADPQRGLIAPDEFIEIAEEIGLIVPIGEWVLREACHYCKACQQAGLGTLRIGVNLSVKQIDSQVLPALIARVLRESGLDPACLELEITESAAMEDFDATVKTLNGIRALGVSTSLDDFGTGHSSLKYVQLLPISALKIDQSFVANIGAKGESGALVKAIIAMAHSLGLSVIAEGVETQEQKRFLQHLQCDELQGFLFSEPLPPQALEHFVRTAQAKVVA